MGTHARRPFQAPQHQTSPLHKVVDLRQPLDLEACLYSGQAFRWRPRHEGWHEGFIQNQPVRLRQRDQTLEIHSTATVSVSAVSRYLGITARQSDARARVVWDNVAQAAVRRFPALRVLEQDAWEVALAFVLSSNSNVAKISSTIDRLSALDSDPLAVRDSTGRTRLPDPGLVAQLSQAQLRATGMGYRARYVHALAQAVHTKRLDLDALASLGADESHARLVAVLGIGHKVADCIQIYGLGQFEAFPLDVWIQRVLRESYFPRKKLSYNWVNAWARKRFGPACGYVQHFLFHHRRTVGPLPRAVSQRTQRRRAASASTTSPRTAPAATSNVTSSNATS